MKHDRATPRAVFRAADSKLIAVVTPTGTTSIAREINASLSRSMGAGIEYLENAAIHWTVTYDEVLFVHESRLTIESGGERHECGPGDIVWLPKGVALRYIARERVG